MVFSPFGLVVGELCRVNLFVMGEEIRWLVKLPALDCNNLVHLLKFEDVSCNFWRVGRARGRVFAYLDII